jgi:hypothetical protein
MCYYRATLCTIMIYFLKTIDNDLVKIGYTKFKDLDRISQIESSCPFPCELVLFIEGTISTERHYHKIFKKHIISGKKEWFIYSDEIKKFVIDNSENSQKPEKSLATSRKRLKSEPVGIRFDEEKLKFIKSREKLETNQRVVDFILNKYWWENKLPHVTAKEAPPLDMKIEYAKATPESYDGKKFNPVDGEPLQFQKPKIALKRTPAHWVELRRECADADEYAQWLQNLEDDPYLTAREKREVKATV